VANHSKGRSTEVKIRCTPDIKDSLTKKMLSSGFAIARGKKVLPNFVDFLEVLADKDLQWFQDNFRKEVDR
jgi:hypothetical protein